MSKLNTNEVVAPPSTDPQYRLQKGDAAFLAQILKARGWHVQSKGERIRAYHLETWQYICGFTWHKATDSLPGHWSFDMNVSDVFSLTDLRLIQTLITRQMSLREHARKAWIAFQDTKSEKRWAVYLGILVSMFHRPPREPEDG